MSQGSQDGDKSDNKKTEDGKKKLSPTQSEISSISFDTRLTVQLSRQTWLENMRDRLNKAQANDYSLDELASSEKLADSYFNQFNSYHEKLCLSSGEDFFDTSYWTEDVHGHAMANHAEILSIIGKLKNEIKKSSPSSGTGESSKNNLARIEIKPFDGQFAAFKTFENVFNSMIGKTSISKVERMVRLKGLLRGEPYDMISNLPITAENFDVAWEKLVNHYDNRKLIISAHIDRLLDLQPVVENPSKGLRRLRNITTEALDALKALKVPTEHWDYIVGRIVRRKIDLETKKAWEVHTGAEREPATLAELLDFLDARARALDNVEQESPATKDKEVSSKFKGKVSKTVKAYQVSQGGDISKGSNDQSTPTTMKSCRFCGSGDHWLGFRCDKFKALTPMEKRRIIESKGLCYNCFGRHHTPACTCTARCKECNGKHHSLIHEGSPEHLKAINSGHQSTASPTTATRSEGPPENSGTRARSSSLSETTSPSSTEPERIYALLNAPENSPGMESASSSIEPVEISAGHHQTSLSDSVEGSAGIHQASTTDQRVVLLATAKALAESSYGSYHHVRILIDQGSEVSFITEQLVNVLHLRRRATNIQIVGIGGVETGSTRGAVTVNLYSRFPEPKNHVEVTAHILAKLTTTLPSIHCTETSTSLLQGLQLADNNFLKPGSIDIIIGADYYGHIIGNDIKKSIDNQLVAQQTLFGWIVSGTVCCLSCKPKSSLTAVRDSSTKQLLDLLKRFWIQEEQISDHQVKFNPEELECEEHFQRTHQRDSTGRYVVRLPLKTSSMALGESRKTALHLLNRTSAKLDSNPSYGKLYKDFIKEYESLGHMRRVSESSEPSPIYYLPHHGVLREDSITTKLRVVFNGSSKTSSGVSLNDILHSGGKLQKDGSDVLIWLRTHRLVVGTDIVKMFRQINVHHEDWDLQRILWKDEDKNLITYQLKTVTYGQTCAPWLALRVLQQLVEDEGHRFPLAAASLTKGRYVDDIYGGADSEDQLKELINQLINICMAGGMPLQKWTSNNQRVLEALELSSTSLSMVEFEEKPVKVLGLCWDPKRDIFTYQSRGISKALINKRTVLSEIAQIYDPLGLIGPVIIRAKIFIQELWLLKIGWDDQLPMSHIKRWQEFRQEFKHLDNISIPRWLGTSSTSSDIQLHGFADASNLAMGAVVYIRVENPGEKPSINLVCAKTRVAPLKKMTIPRLELTAAVLLTQLVIYVQRMLERENLQLFLWSDSTVALTWINGHPSRWTDFIQNRVIKIQSSLPSAEWRHISGKENPADCASRGLCPTKLADHQLWWNGPSWLKSDQSTWPSSPIIETSTEAALEERPVRAHPVAAAIDQPQDILDAYPTLEKVLRISARVMRVIQAMKLQPVPDSINLQPEELDDVRIYFIKFTQNNHFAQVINQLSNGRSLNDKHPLSKLTPYLDEDGTLRLGGRLKRSNLEPETKNPAILPRHSRFTALVIEEAHRKTLHGGVQATLAYIRQRYWIVGGRHPVKSHILHCIDCARVRAIRAQQLMGQLPPRRITPARPFLHSGVDFAGPLKLIRWRGSGAVQYQAYIAVFVCLATSAVHLELVTDLTTEAFIETYKRFTGRRGICATLSSDNATTFVGAQKELGNLLSRASKEFHIIADTLASQGTKWIFIPAASPHYGGKWEAAVKSVKYHLSRLIGSLVLTYEELNTLLVQIEAQLNSRPLCPLSDDPEDCRALTPGHFIIGDAINAIPEPSLLGQRLDGHRRWKMITQIAQQFWERWSKECIQRYQAISKWKNQTEGIKVGSLVLIVDERFPPTKWALGRVTRIHPSSDNLPRVVDLIVVDKSSLKTVRPVLKPFTRHINRLVPLPVSTEEEEADHSSLADDEGGRNVEN